jgi:hypothetical protein
MKNVKLRCGLILLLFLMNGALIIAQSGSIIGRVVDDSGIDVSSVLVISGDSHAVTDEQGVFNLSYLNSVNDSIQISFSSIGYEDLDTLVSVRNALTITLKQKDYVLPEVELVSKKNLFAKDDWVILDYIVREDGFTVLASEVNTKFLYVYDDKGEFITKQKTDRQYTRFHRSCLGKLHLIGTKYCNEIDYKNDNFILSKPYSVDQFEGFLEPCIYKFGNYPLNKVLTDNNKKVNYFTYRDKKQVGVFEVKDDYAIEAAKEKYYDILSKYKRTVQTNQFDSTAINKGFAPDDILQDGSWSGNLFDLIISNKLMEDISYFIYVEQQPIPVAEIFLEEDYYVLNLKEKVATEIRQAPLESGKSMSLSGQAWDNYLDVLNDLDTGTAYILDKEKALHRISVNKESLQTQKVVGYQENGFFIKNRKLDNGTCYYVSCLEVNKPNTRLFKLVLSD